MLTIPRAIIAAGLCVGLCLLGGTLIAPYRVGGGSDGTWRLNTITGEMQLCGAAFGGCRSPVLR